MRTTQVVGGRYARKHLEIIRATFRSRGPCRESGAIDHEELGILDARPTRSGLPSIRASPEKLVGLVQVLSPSPALYVLFQVHGAREQDIHDLPGIALVENGLAFQEYFFV
jgi:hypothetical protein